MEDAHLRRRGGKRSPQSAQLTVRLQITAAAGQHQAWIATSFTGTLVVKYQRIFFNANSSCIGDPVTAQVRSVN